MRSLVENELKKEGSMQLEKEIYLQDVAEQWKTELNTDQKVYVLSPYITSIAESLLENIKDKENCEIYTTFEVRNFLSGSSDVKTLKNLINKGFKIHLLPELHAKIILVSDRFVSIGSQNLTNNGSRNKEATVISREKEIIQFVEDKIKIWITERKRISLKNLEDVENILAELKEDYKKFEDEIEKADEFVREQERQREIERDKKLERQNKNLLEISKSVSSVLGKIEPQQKHHSLGGWITDYYTLWTFKPKKREINLVELFNLKKQTRYLALNESNYKLSWARVNEKSITLFANGITFTNEKIEIDGKHYRWSVKSNLDTETISDFNLTAIIELDEISTELKLSLLFDYKTLSIYSISPELDSFEASYQKQVFQKIIDWITQNNLNFMEIISKEILNSFNYVDKLTGHYANKFLNEKQTYELRVGKIDKQQLLIFEELFEE